MDEEKMKDEFVFLINSIQNDYKKKGLKIKEIRIEWGVD